MDSTQFQRLLDGLDRSFDKVVGKVRGSKARYINAMSDVSATIRDTAGERTRRQEKAKLRAELAATATTVQGFCDVLADMQQQLNTAAGTLTAAAATASAGSIVTTQLESIATQLTDMKATLDQCVEGLDKATAAGRIWVTQAEQLFTSAAEIEELRQATERYTTSKDAAQAAVQRYQQVQLQCSEVAVRAQEAAQFDCPMQASELCIENGGCHHIYDRFLMQGCEHCLCRGCAQGWAGAELDSGRKPSCIVCKHPWCQEDMMATDGDLLQRFVKLEMHEDVVANSLAKCPSCNTAVEPQNGATHFHCTLCGRDSCLACQVPWHENSSCEAYQRWKRDNEGFDDRAFRQWLRSNEGRVHKVSAGGCGHAMVKRDCNSVWCSICRYYFCWYCLKRIAEDGASNAQRHAHFDVRGTPCYGKCFEKPKWDDDE